MVEEQSGIEIAVQVDAEAMAAFEHDQVVAGDPGRQMLRRLVAADALARTVLHDDPFAGDVEHVGRDARHVVDPLAMLGVALLPAGVDLLDLQPGVAVRMRLEAIDDHRELRDVAVVDAIGMDVGAARPAPQVTRVLREAMMEIGEVGHGGDCTKRVATLRSTTNRRRGRCGTLAPRIAHDASTTTGGARIVAASTP